MSEIEQRADIVRMLVLSEVSDDYEEFGHICAGLATFDGKVGLPIQPTVARQALDALLANGLVKAYRLSTRQPVEEIQGLPSEDARDVYYWATEKGKLELAVWVVPFNLFNLEENSK